MSTWTSSAARRGIPVRAPIALIALALLAACALPQGGDAPAVTRATVAEGAVTLAAPRGYCIDTATQRSGAQGAFVLFGSCAALAPGPFAPAPRPLAALTAAVSTPRGDGMPPFEQTFDTLSAFFASRAGRAALSRSGDPARVEVLEAFARDGFFYLHLRDRSAFAGPRVAAEYWRALFQQGDRIVTLSVLSPRDAPVPPAAGRQVLDGFVARVRAANR